MRQMLLPIRRFPPEFGTSNCLKVMNEMAIFPSSLKDYNMIQEMFLRHHREHFTFKLSEEGDKKPQREDQKIIRSNRHKCRNLCDEEQQDKTFVTSNMLS